MSTMHTTGRLSASYTNIGKVIAENGAVIARCEKLTSLSQLEANARRIAACWNACEGFRTDELVSITDMGDTLHSRFEARNAEDRELCAINAELLDAAQSALMAITGYTHQNEITKAATAKLVSAIAKATGKEGA